MIKSHSEGRVTNEHRFTTIFFRIAKLLVCVGGAIVISLVAFEIGGFGATLLTIGFVVMLIGLVAYFDTSD